MRWTVAWNSQMFPDGFFWLHHSGNDRLKYSIQQNTAKSTQQSSLCKVNIFKLKFLLKQRCKVQNVSHNWEPRNKKSALDKSFLIWFSLHLNHKHKCKISKWMIDKQSEFPLYNVNFFNLQYIRGWQSQHNIWGFIKNTSKCFLNNPQLIMFKICEILHWKDNCYSHRNRT